MTVKLRAVYEDGRLRLLDPVELREGQQVDVIIEGAGEVDTVKAALGDLARWPDPADDHDADVEIQADAIARAFSVGRPVSEIIIEDRGEA